MRYVYWAIIVGVCMSLSPGGILPRDMNSRQYSEWASAQQAVPHKDVKTFTPTNFTGFSVPPTGDLFYADLGSLAVIWTDVPFLGTSNAGSFLFEGVPEAIRPRENASIVMVAYDGGVYVLAFTTVLPDGSIDIRKAAVSGTDINLLGGSFAAAGTKGLIEGTFLLYPKY